MYGNFGVCYRSLTKICFLTKCIKIPSIAFKQLSQNLHKEMFNRMSLGLFEISCSQQKNNSERNSILEKQLLTMKTDAKSKYLSIGNTMECIYSFYKSTINETPEKMLDPFSSEALLPITQNHFFLLKECF